jgi:serine-type D-Ala-D-Ala carboxypeptidase/endopeptidase (penicillin-binding protein 4)
MGGRRRRTVAAAASLLLLATAGYAVGDVYDVVPGKLTTEPAPEPPLPFPTAPGAVVPTGAADVLGGVDASATTPDPLLLGQLLSPLVHAPQLGPAVSASVVDALTGAQLYGYEAVVPREPASVAKLLTAAAALRRLGPEATVSTRVVRGVGPGEVVLLGGGDVLLSAGSGNADVVNGRAGLADLAAATATRLRADGTTAVAVRLDDTLFSGDPMGPGWTASDVRNGFVAPVSAVAVNAGRIGDENYAPRVADPALSAAETFAQLLAAQGITVAGPVVRAVAPAEPEVLAEVTSATVADVVHYMLEVSDNNVAEALARLVAHDVGRPSAFADAARTVLEEVALIGIDTSSSRLVDGSGLGDGSRLAPSLLTALLSAAASQDHPELRPLLTGLPVAGLSGTLAGRFEHQPAAAGIVHGKTGSLSGVTSLAGTVVDADGRLLAFAVLAEQVPGTDAARHAVDAVVAVVAGCGCR